jgi:GTP cyclohydrolase II
LNFSKKAIFTLEKIKKRLPFESKNTGRKIVKAFLNKAERNENVVFVFEDKTQEQLPVRITSKLL